MFKADLLVHVGAHQIKASVNPVRIEILRILSNEDIMLNHGSQECRNNS